MEGWEPVQGASAWSLCRSWGCKSTSNLMFLRWRTELLGARLGLYWGQGASAWLYVGLRASAGSRKGDKVVQYTYLPHYFYTWRRIPTRGGIGNTCRDGSTTRQYANVQMSEWLRWTNICLFKPQNRIIVLHLKLRSSRYTTKCYSILNIFCTKLYSYNWHRLNGCLPHFYDFIFWLYAMGHPSK